MEEHDMELTAKEVAQIFGVKPVTVGMWHRTGRLVGVMPRNANRTGRRFSLSAVRAFARNANDGGYSERQLEDWLRGHELDSKANGVLIGA